MKKVFFFMLIIILLSSVSALGCDKSGYKGNFQIETNFNISVACPTCDYINYSVTNPLGDTIRTETEATKVGGIFYFYFNSTDSANTGYYFIDGYSNLDTPVGLCFNVDRSGEDIETADSLMYILLTFAVLFLFLLSLYFAIIMPYQNEVNHKGAVFKICKLKYVKLGLILLSYVLFVWLMNVLIGISDNFANLRFYYGFVSFIFDTLNLMALPFAIFILVLCGAEIIRDTNMAKEIKKFGSALR